MNEFQRCRAFGKPRIGTRLVKTSPPLVHLTPYVSGGLGQLYSNIQDGSKDWLQDFGQFTDESGVFVARPGMPLLAGRYKYLGLLGKGQSSVLIKAQDTFLRDLVSIKVLHTHYNVLGAQEMDCIRKLNQADPEGFSPILQLKTVFTFDDHYCMVFELLNPKSLLTHFKGITQPQTKMQCIRKVVLQLLQALGFFRQQNVIHADLKPENILLQNEGDFSRLKVVDLGNALHCIHDELSLYYDDFELQTLLYRAPEVMYGVPFGLEVDMWSLGCIVAELYMGHALFFGTNKTAILSKMVDILGPLPRNIFQRGKFYEGLQSYTSPNSQRDGIHVAGVLMKLLHTTDYAFVDFLLGLLQYDPAKRMSISEAAQHAFLAPELALRYLLPPADDQSKCTGYQPVILSQKSYPHSPRINPDVSKQHLTSVGLLRHGSQSTTSPKTTPKKVAEILPFLRDDISVHAPKVNVLTPPVTHITNNNIVPNDRELTSDIVRPIIPHLCPPIEGQNKKQLDTVVMGTSPYEGHSASRLINSLRISMETHTATTAGRKRLRFVQDTCSTDNAQISPPRHFDAQRPSPSSPEPEPSDTGNHQAQYSAQSRSQHRQKLGNNQGTKRKLDETKFLDAHTWCLTKTEPIICVGNMHKSDSSGSSGLRKYDSSGSSGLQKSDSSGSSGLPKSDSSGSSGLRKSDSSGSSGLRKSDSSGSSGLRKSDSSGSSDPQKSDSSGSSDLQKSDSSGSSGLPNSDSSGLQSIRSTERYPGISKHITLVAEEQDEKLNETCILSKSPGLSDKAEYVSFTRRCGTVQCADISEDSGANSCLGATVDRMSPVTTDSDLSGTGASSNEGASNSVKIHVPHSGPAGIAVSERSMDSHGLITASQNYANKQFQDVYVIKSKACDAVAEMDKKTTQIVDVDNPPPQSKPVRKPARVRLPNCRVLSDPRGSPLEVSAMTPTTKKRALQSAGLLCGSVCSSSASRHQRAAGTSSLSMVENQSVASDSDDVKLDFKNEKVDVGIDVGLSGDHNMCKLTEQQARRKIEGHCANHTKHQTKLQGRINRKRPKRKCSSKKQSVNKRREADDDDWSPEEGSVSDTSAADSLDLSGPEDGSTDRTPTKSRFSRGHRRGSSDQLRIQRQTRSSLVCDTEMPHSSHDGHILEPQKSSDDETFSESMSFCITDEVDLL